MSLGVSQMRFRAPPHRHRHRGSRAHERPYLASYSAGEAQGPPPTCPACRTSVRNHCATTPSEGDIGVSEGTEFRGKELRGKTREAGAQGVSGVVMCVLGWFECYLCGVFRPL